MLDTLLYFYFIVLYVPRKSQTLGIVPEYPGFRDTKVQNIKFLLQVAMCICVRVMSHPSS